MTSPEHPSRNPVQSNVSFANNGVPTEVWFVQGKKANRAFKATLNRENATLSEENPPHPNHGQEKDSQPDVREETRHDVADNKHQSDCPTGRT